MTDTETTPKTTVRVARWSATHPVRALALWLVFVAACMAIGQAAGLRSLNTDSGVGRSGHAQQVLHDAHLTNPATEDVLISARSGRLDAASARRAATDVTERMRALPEVAAVAEPATSARGDAVLVEVTITGDPDTAGDRVAALQRATTAAGHDNPSLRVEQVGSASMNNAVNAQVSSDLGTAALVSIPVTLLILLVAFGAIIAAGVPVLLALSAVISAIGLSTVASHLIPDSGTTSSMILLMGMAVGVDYSLFFVKRAREERARGRGHLDAIEVAAQTSGHSVIVSGFAVIVAMLGLFVVGDPVFASLAAGSILVVAVAVLGSLTVLPAVLAKLGGHIDRPRVPVLWRLSSQDREPRVWPALLRPATRHPAATLAVSVLGLVLLALPAIGLRLHSDSAASLPTSIAEVQSLDRLTAAFPGQSTTQDVVVRAPAADAGQVAAALDTLAARAGAPDFVASATPAITASSDRTVHELELQTPFDEESDRAKQALHMLRTELAPDTIGRVASADWAVGGATAMDSDFDAQLGARIGWVIAFVVVLTMLMMAAVFRSAVIAGVTAVTNLLSAGAAFGVLTVIFQHHWAESLLGFRSTGAVINWIPLFTFAVLFGLSMDYHVFVLGRIRELVDSGVPPREAVRSGIVRSAGTVTSAAIVMVSVFAIFASLHMIEMKEMGIGLAVAVLVDALVVRAVVLPSLLILLGRRAWPARRVPVVGADEPAPRYSLVSVDRPGQ